MPLSGGVGGAPDRRLWRRKGGCQPNEQRSIRPRGRGDYCELRTGAPLPPPPVYLPPALARHPLAVAFAKAGRFDRQDHVAAFIAAQHAHADLFAAGIGVARFARRCTRSGPAKMRWRRMEPAGQIPIHHRLSSFPTAAYAGMDRVVLFLPYDRLLLNPDVV